MKTCAIVGNSSSLLTTNFGEFIDSHDHVVRFNIAKTLGFESHVGSKCTKRFSNLHPVMCYLYDSHLAEHKKVFPEYDNKAILGWNNQEIYFKNARIIEGTNLQHLLLSRGNTINHIPEKFINDMKNSIGSEPTMGIVAITILLQEFESLNCFGFDFYESAGDFHYFEKTLHYQSCHNSSKEKSIIMSLQDSGRIQIHR